MKLKSRLNYSLIRSIETYDFQINTNIFFEVVERDELRSNLVEVWEGKGIGIVEVNVNSCFLLSFSH